ncbi:MAG: UDP-N-acetylglucosamine 2-epimerase [Candidatus Lokiarchaeia archaeon]
MKIAAAVQAHPQFIKSALVPRALRQESHIREILIHTGQHYESNASDVFFDEMEIPKSDYHLGSGSGGHSMQIGRMQEAIEEVLLKESPSWVLVYGDTNSTLAGALVAVKLHIRLAHKVITDILMVMDEWYRLLLNRC